MTRSRLTLSVDTPNQIIVFRYIGGIDGADINVSMIDQLRQIDQPWAYDNIVDLRRHEGLVTAGEIEDLGRRWQMLAQGRDAGGCIAIVTDDPLVFARLPITRGAFPGRIVEGFALIEEAMGWIESQRGQRRAIA
jgi:hypothetical protein